MEDLELDSVDVAAYIVKVCAVRNYFVNLTKIQKILFCCYGAVLADCDARLTKEQPKAWGHGPVFPRVYKQKKRHLDGFIQAMLEHKENVAKTVDPRVLRAIVATIDLFGKYTAGALVRWTHKQGSPWDIATNGGKDLYKAIPDDIIKNYFLGFINKQN